jgi:CRP-like cAMP-binding protein
MNDAFLQLFSHLPEEDSALILSAFEPRTFKEGETLFKGGKVCREMFFVCKGVLRIMVVNDKGMDVTHFFLTENRFCTILNSFNNEVMAEESIQAACDTEALAVSRERLLELYGRLPYLKDLITRITQQALLDKIAIRNAYLGEDSAARYRLFLEKQPDIARRVSLKDVASYLGITPQSLSRIRKGSM